MHWKLAIFVPSEYRFDPSDSAGTTNLADITFDAPVLRAGVVFDQKDKQQKLDWSIRFKKS
jgi:hypothetical protein